MQKKPKTPFSIIVDAAGSIKDTVVSGAKTVGGWIGKGIDTVKGWYE